MCMYMKQPMNFQVILLINETDEKVASAMEEDFVSNNLVCVLLNKGSKDIEEYDKNFHLDCDVAQITPLKSIKQSLNKI